MKEHPLPLDHLPELLQYVVMRGESETAEEWMATKGQYSEFVKATVALQISLGREKRVAALSTKEGKAEVLDWVANSGPETPDLNLLLILTHLSDDTLRDKVWPAMDGDEFLESLPPELQEQVRAGLRR